MAKVLVVATVASMIDLFNMENIKIIKKNGHEVEVACNFQQGSITSIERVKEFQKELNELRVPFHDINFPRSFFKFRKLYRSYKKLRLLIKNGNFDLLHCHTPVGGALSRFSVHKRDKKQTKILYTAHGFHFYKGSSLFSWLIYYPIEKLLARKTHTLITINKEDYRRASNRFKANIKYVPGIGIDINKFKNNDDKRFRRELALNDNTILIVSVGQLSRRKNHQAIIKALSKIQDIEYKYVLVGDGEKKEFLKRLSAKLGISDNVVFVGYRKDISIILNSADLFVFPSLQEGLPVSLMEAMASNIPVICSDIRGNNDLVVDGENGFLCRINDRKCYSESIIKSLKIDKIRLTKFNQETLAKFSVNNVNLIMDSIFDSLIGVMK